MCAPSYTDLPVGGYHVHYTYANLLQARGHQVCVLFPGHLSLSSSWKGRAKAPIWAFKICHAEPSANPHFKFRNGVRIKFVSDLGGARLPKADALIATSFRTASALTRSGNTGAKIYIVYDFGYWRTAEPATRKRMERTYTPISKSFRRRER